MIINLNEIIKIIDKSLEACENRAEEDGQSGDIESYNALMECHSQVTNFKNAIQETFDTRQSLNVFQLQYCFKDVDEETKNSLKWVLQIYTSNLEYEISEREKEKKLIANAIQFI